MPHGRVPAPHGAANQYAQARLTGTVADVVQWGAQAMLDGYWQQIDTLSRNMGNVDPIIARREIIKAITQLQ